MQQAAAAPVFLQQLVAAQEEQLAAAVLMMYPMDYWPPAHQCQFALRACDYHLWLPHPALMAYP